MTDTPSVVTQSAAKVIEAAKKVLEAIEGQDKEGKEGEGKEKEEKGKVTSSPAEETAPPDVPRGLDTGALEAVERFRKASRWVLGAFVAFGVFVFGSLPFSDVTKEGRNGWLIVPGLLVTAAGKH